MRENEERRGGGWNYGSGGEKMRRKPTLTLKTPFYMDPLQTLKMKWFRLKIYIYFINLLLYYNYLLYILYVLYIIYYKYLLCIL